jgi:hypothetical protein
MSTNVSDTPKNDDGTTITITGDIEASIAVDGFCGTGVVGDDLQYNASGVTATGNAYMLQIYINGYSGPGEYSVAEPGSSYDASITYSDGVGGPWITDSSLSGTVVVTEDGSTGTVDATLENHENTNQQANISGNWVCQPD